MKSWKIKTRMTFLYTVMLMLFMFLFFFAASFVFSRTLVSEAENRIQKDARIIAEEVEMEDGELTIDLEDDELDNIDPSILFSIYTKTNDLYARNHRQNWVEIITQEMGRIRPIEHDDAQWMVYDTEVWEDGQHIAWLRVASPLSTIASATRQFRLIFIGGLFIALIFSIIVGQWIAQRSLSPVSSIIKTAKSISEGDLSQRLHFEHAHDEIGELAKTFDHMLDNVEASFRREKQFTSDASHELRTPIAIIMAQAEEALYHDDATKQDYREALSIVHQKSEEMHQMLSQLLWLARGYEQTQTLEMDELDMDIVLEDIADEMALRAKEKNIHITLDLEAAVQMRVNLMLFTRMMINILDNAIKYGKENGHITIQMRRITENEHPFLRLCVADDGRGISEKDLPHIFERFYRVDGARTGEGSGLGLSLVKWIVNCHHGTIDAQSEEGVGSQFILLFPLKEESTII